MENITNNIEKIYLNNLIKACEKNNINKTFLEKKIEALNSDSENNNKIIKKNVSNNTLSNISESPTSHQYSDDYLYQKIWTKLTAIHKIIKIKEYINSLLIKDESEKQILKEKLIDLVKNKILTKKDSVLYDSVKGKIISIPLLEYKNGQYNIKS